METGERLAAYVAGELDEDETRALEAQLARDPGLRARLASIRATDDLLAGLPPVEVPAAFSARLREAVAAEVASQVASPAGDDLAARRARRAERTGFTGWQSWQKLATAAAVLVVVGGVGVGVLTAGGDSDDAGGQVAMEAGLAAEPQQGPTVVAAGRSFDEASLRDLAGDARFDEILAEHLSGPAADAAAQDHTTALTGPAPESDGSDSAGDTAISGESAEEGDRVMTAPGAPTEFGLRTVGDVSETDLEAVRTCLPSLIDSTSAVIPVYAELATYEGTDAIVYGLVGNDPEQDSYQRVELWVVDRGDCQVLHFAQVDR